MDCLPLLDGSIAELYHQQTVQPISDAHHSKRQGPVGIQDNHCFTLTVWKSANYYNYQFDGSDFVEGVVDIICYRFMHAVTANCSFQVGPSM